MSASGAASCPHADASFAKPIPLEELVALLPERSERPAPPAAPPSLAERLGIELSASETADLITRFLSDARRRCSEAREHLGRGELARVADTGHLLRGACASIGAAELARIAAGLEAAAQRAAADEAGDWLDRLEQGLAAGVPAPA
jgi:HPt (histidine-containing phosphotransfer) domain-containing protein